MMHNTEHKVIIACDVGTLIEYEKIIERTNDISGVGGYKIPSHLTIGYGLPTLVEKARKYTDKKLIYDHEKAGTNTPHTAQTFAQQCKRAGVDGIIIYPLAGPETERALIDCALEQQLHVIAGGYMSHKHFAVSEGGFIADEGILMMYKIAARRGITDFGVPANKPKATAKIREALKKEGVNPTLYGIGVGDQGGSIATLALLGGNPWHVIIGRAIINAKDERKAALEYARQLQAL
jgi:orotidine-5'-phosphate decarboxylase